MKENLLPKQNRKTRHANSALSDHSSHSQGSLTAFRGFAIAALISLPFWALLIYLVYHWK